MRAAGVLLAAAAVLAGCGGPGAPTHPEKFALSLTNRILRNNYRDAWLDLHPVDQKVAPLEEYVGCEERSPIIARPLSLKVVSVTDESVGLGNNQFVQSKAVHIRMVFEGGFKLVHTVHVVSSSGKWKWILPSWRYRDYRADTCPTAESPQPSA